ncbi:hypothetical protein NECID01_1864 [Nematocida sp. AWRm77]|nr:hypothetical protein NECID01_1864 [Nematocida sp. AWRm77]
MKYSCKLCKVIIKYKTSSGWIDHIRGVTHQRNRSKVLGSSFLSLLDTLVAQKKLTHTEHREIQEKYTPGMDSREVAEMVRRVLRGHMMDRHSG